MIYCDHRIAGEPRYILSDTEPHLMIVPDEVRKCVAFVGYRRNDGMVILAGTCFFLGKTIEGTDRSFVYAITAKHVIDGIRDNGSSNVLLRLNLRNDNARWFDTNILDWKFHPDDQDVDVALMSISFPDELDHLMYPITSIATEEVIQQEGIGIGEEVFLTGLFVHHHGQHRNIPIVRAGNIAAMPEEKIQTSSGFMDAYLIEARSIGGLSGSPVFVHLGLIRIRENQPRFATIPSGIFYLLGLMHGHFAPERVDIDEVVSDVAQRDRINMGIAIVVPVSKILEVINQPEMAHREREIAEQIRREQLPVMDSSDTELS